MLVNGANSVKHALYQLISTGMFNPLCQFLIYTLNGDKFNSFIEMTSLASACY